MQTITLVDKNRVKLAQQIPRLIPQKTRLIPQNFPLHVQLLHKSPSKLMQKLNISSNLLDTAKKCLKPK